MAQPSSRRIPATVLAFAASLALTAGVVAPAVAGASAHKHRGTLIKVETSKKYGKILVNSSGRTLYFLTADSSASPACTTGSCTSLWPPLMSKGKPRAGKGISKKKLGTAKRGSHLQATYDGHRLYFYAGDVHAGQVTGESIKSFGGTWYVLSGKGAPVKAALSSSKNSSGGGGGGGSGGGGSGGGGYGGSGGGW